MKTTRYTSLCLANPSRGIRNLSPKETRSLLAILASKALRTICLAMMRALPVALFFSLSVVALKASDDAPLKSGNESDVVTAIKIAQKSNVRESRGPEADECFTDADYQEFTARKMPRKIAQSLRSDRKFMEGVLALREKPAGEHGTFIRPLREQLMRVRVGLSSPAKPG